MKRLALSIALAALFMTAPAWAQTCDSFAYVADQVSKWGPGSAMTPLEGATLERFKSKYGALPPYDQIGVATKRDGANVAVVMFSGGCARSIIFIPVLHFAKMIGENET